MSLHRLKDLIPEIVPLQQVAESEDRGFVRDPLADQVNTCKPTHRRHLDQRILHRRVAEVVPLLHQVNPQHGFKGIRRSTSFGASLGVTGLDQGDQRPPRHNSLHLSQKSLPLVAPPRSAFGRCKGAFPRSGLLVITEGEAFRAAVAELLPAHEPLHHLL